MDYPWPTPNAIGGWTVVTRAASARPYHRHCSSAQIDHLRFDRGSTVVVELALISPCSRHSTHARATDSARHPVRSVDPSHMSRGWVSRVVGKGWGGGLKGIR